MNVLKFSILSLLFIQLSIAQNPNHIILGEEQLSNTNIYSTYQDDVTDLIYIGTDQGLYVYKENKFQKLKITNKADGNSYFNIKSNYKGEIFCNNIRGQIFKIEDDSIKLFFEFNHKRNTLPTYYFDKNNNMILIYRNDVFYIDRNKNVLDLLKRNNLDKDNFIFINRHFQLKNDAIYCLNHKDKNLYKIEDKVIHRTRYKFPDIETNWFFLDEKLIDYKQNTNESIYKNFDFNFKNIEKQSGFKLYNDDIYTRGLTNGIYKIFKKKDSLVYKEYFTDQFLSCINTNRNGSKILGTFKGGLKLIPNIEQKVFNFGNVLLTDIEKNENNEVFVSSRDGHVYNLKNIKKEVTKIKYNIDNIVYVKGIEKINSSFKKDIIYQYSKTLGFKDLISIDDSNLCYYKGYNIVKLDKQSLKKEAPRSFRSSLRLNEKINSISLGNENSIYFGTNKNLLVIHNKQFKVIDTLKYRNENIEGLKTLHSNGGTLFCGTEDKGVLVFEEDNFKYKISKEQGLKNNSVKKIIQKDSLLFIQSSIYIQVYNLKSKSFIPLGFNEGITNDIILSFVLTEKDLWIMEKHKVYNVPFVKIIAKKKVGNLFFEKLNINGETYQTKNAVNLNSSENNITFLYDYREIESKDNATISYKLEGYNKYWKNSSAYVNEINYEYLPPGEYTFKIKAIYGNSETDIKSYSFYIPYPFYQRWWFYSINIFVVIFFAYLIFKKREKVKEKRSKEIIEKEILSKNLAESQLKALRSQMNPHFIFNSLNSIQSLVLKQEIDRSYDYISLFAELVRNALNYSEKEFIQLEKEINFLNIYLQLEELRFNGDFKYNIVDETKGSDYYIPSLIIQPFIENALIHGLLHKKGSKELSITFRYNNYLICEIIDNGIGREKSKEIQLRQGQSHESFSTKAIKKRLEILTDKLGKEASFEYTDMEEGTKVIIKLPYEKGF